MKEFEVVVYLSVLVEGDQISYTFKHKAPSEESLLEDITSNSFVYVPSKNGKGFTLVNMQHVSEIYVQEEK